ncbi:DUF2333 family protein [Methylophaga sp.]|uniref:DUF2333 family protein n=1 Tax=Methylophaga sp. TaxID=2024840 RepID=UPI003F69F4B4
MALNQLTQKFRDIGWTVRDSFADNTTRKRIIKISGIAVGAVIAIMILIMIWWSMTPDRFDPLNNAQVTASEQHQQFVTGYTSTTTLITLVQTLLDKPGGYITNDVMPPSVWMDNMPNWEFGVLVQVRDFSRALRNDISRSQSQSLEDNDLAIAEPQFNFNSDSWLFPPTEREYRKGIKALQSYRQRLSNDSDNDAQFYARADNLSGWLSIAGKRLGSLSQRLTASVGQVRVNTDLSGDPEALQSTPTAAEVVSKTPWNEIDDVFFEARGTTWALIHLLKAIEYDFNDILRKKNALVSLRQIIRELEATQETVMSPIILNGGGFGLFANHSLVMASYISRANAAIIDLRDLLNRG